MTAGMTLARYSFRHRAEVLERIKREALQLGIAHTIHTRNLVDAALTRDDGRELQRLRIPFVRKKTRELCLRLGVPYTPPLEE